MPSNDNTNTKPQRKKAEKVIANKIEPQKVSSAKVNKELVTEDSPFWDGKLFQGSEFVKSLSEQPGVYIMFDTKSNYLYVGKARNLKKRVASYFRDAKQLTPKTRVLVKKIHHMEIIETTTESEALLLESNLIKTQKPRYNVSLRDNKSYPYIVLDASHAFPRLDIYRGKKKKGMKFFGPYPSATAVRQTLSLLQKLFLVRLCHNSYYSHRSRPCLQYQIKRCTAPCVGKVSESDYAQQIAWVEMFLNGKSQDLVIELTKQMHGHAEKLAFEKAGEYRDIINSIRHVMSHQNIESGEHNLDVMGFAFGQSKLAMCVTFIRLGRVVGDKRFLIEDALWQSPIELLEQFIIQYYDNKPVPNELILMSLEQLLVINNHIQSIQNDLNSPNEVDDSNTNLELETLDDSSKMFFELELEAMQNGLQDALSKIANKNIVVKSSVRGIREKWQLLTQQSAKLHLQQHEENQHRLSQDFRYLKDYFSLNNVAKKIACVDISHMMGKQTYASFVVFDHQGPLKREYRAYKIKDVTAGDDYAAIEQTVERAVIQLKKNEMPLPDILFIDGGKGQLKAAHAALLTLQESFDDLASMRLIAVAKGRERKEGKEQFIWYDNSSLKNNALSNATKASTNKNVDNIKIIIKPFDVTEKSLHLIQQVRNEAHRFAISKHRKARGKQQVSSVLNDIPGIGEQKKQALINYFGGLQGIVKASAAELKLVNGISDRLANTIYHFLH